MSEIVFILGAGASKEAGAPLMDDFLDRADLLRKTEDLGQYKIDFDTVFGAISGLQIVHSKSELDLDNIESVFAAFEIAKLIKKLPGLSDSDVIPNIIASLRRLIALTLDKTIMYPNFKPNNAYNSLVNFIIDYNKFANIQNISIITFNYDIALDYAIRCNNSGIDYGLGIGTGIPLFKLHGSLNWANCTKCNTIVPWDVSLIARTGFTAFENNNLLEVFSILAKSGLKHCEVNVEPTPIIVPPTWNKTEHHELIEQVWTQAARALSDAENIFISGYSLPESDLFFRYLFALGSVGTSRIKRFWVFDPDKDDVVEPRFREMMGIAAKARFKFYKKTFREAIPVIKNEMKTRNR